METLLSLFLFALSTSIAPGPNTLMAMASGLNFGTRKSLPLLFGISLGFAAMLFCIGLGLGQLMQHFPQLSLVIKALGSAYLLYLAYAIATSHNIDNGTSKASPMSFYKGVLFQWVNGKAWVVSMSAISVFTTPGEQYLMQTLTLTLAFVLVGPPCVAVWVVSGTTLKQYLNHSHHVRQLNRGLALLLVVSILPILGELLLISL